MVMGESCRLRIDSVLVDKFRRLPGGINEIGVKIVRDIGLRYEYDKNNLTLDIIGPDPEILGLAIETLRFLVENDEYPHTGVTCQVGYPNKCIVIWRFHGDYAKKFDHLFVEEIRKVKLIPTVNIKAVPSKKKLEYVELYCHFSVYHQVKDEVLRLISELSRIYQEDFFVPKSDHQKARKFALSKSNDSNVLYALKEYPENDKIRVWIFSRDQSTGIRAKKEWVLHVGTVARDTEYSEEVKRDKDSMKSASFFGGHRSSVVSTISGPMANNLQIPYRQLQSFSHTKSTNVSPRTSKNKNDKSPRSVANVAKYDNPNFPRPFDFMFPILLKNEIKEEQTDESDEETNPFAFDASKIDELNPQGGENQLRNNTLAGHAKWVAESDPQLYQARRHSRPMPPIRIYVHHQVGGQTNHHQQQQFSAGKGVSQVVHPDTNIIANERFRPTHQSDQVLTSVTDARFAPAVKRGSKNVRPGVKQSQKAVKVKASTRSRPVLQENKPVPNVRYHINVNGLDIFMYYKSVEKLDNVDALVNVLNTDLKTGGMVSAAMFEAAGKQVRDEIAIHLQLNGPLRVAENIVTSAGRIPTLGIIHVAGPVWENYTNIAEEECARDLHTAVYRALKTAEKHKYRKMGMPVIGAEPFFGIPKDLVAEVYVKALVDYSMAMGPLYPVLEIHLVDTDVQMLTHIKDAYERWASDPAVIDMTHRLTTDNPLHTPAELSQRAQSAVLLKEIPTHTSQNMVTFVDQSYTNDGNQKWTFEVLKKLTVHVYTGSVVKENEVEAIVCGVDANMKGSLAKHVLYAGGRRYENSLKHARSKQQSLREGEVLVCDGGDLDVDIVLHSVISRPIYMVNRTNLSRLDSVNAQLLYAANKLGLTSLAMPLIGTGRLREKFEVEQCSLQLVDNIIEVCLSTGNSLTLRELHLVNSNQIMTQSLTQALRTRAHTKLRMEREPHAPSRQEVLTHSETHRSTSDLPVHTDNATARNMIGQVIRVDESTEAGKTAHAEAGKTADDIKTETNKSSKDHIKTGVIITGESNRNDEHHIQKGNDGKHEKVAGNSQEREEKKRNAEANGKVRRDKKGSKNSDGVYLSENNLRAHTELLTNNWVQDADPYDNRQSSDKAGKRVARRHNQLEPIEHDLKMDKTKPPKQEWKDPNGRPAVIPPKPSKVHKRKLPNLRKPQNVVIQRSRAESYKSLYERKKIQRDDAAKMKRSLSQGGMTSKEISDRVLEGFKKERIRLQKTSHKNKKGVGGDEDTDVEDGRERQRFKESLIQAEKFYTRNTGQRYEMKNKRGGGNGFDEYERMDRVDVRNNDVARRGSKTDRGDTDASRKNQERMNKGYQTERVMMANEREDMYMMDMDFNVKVIDSQRGYNENDFERAKDVNASTKSNNHTKNRKMSMASQRITEENGREKEMHLAPTEIGRTDADLREEENGGKREEKIYKATTGVGRTDADLREDYMEPEMDVKSQNAFGNRHNERTSENDQTLKDAVPLTEKSARMTRTSAKYTESSFPETDIPLPEHLSASARARNQKSSNHKVTEHHNKDNDSLIDESVKRSINAINEQIVENESPDIITEENREHYTDVSEKNMEIPSRNDQLPAHASKEENILAIPDQNESVKPIESNNENKRELDPHFKGVNEHIVTSNVRQENIQQIPSKSEDVTIRDKIRLQIDVVDKIDGKKIAKEKEKIERFWEVVGKDGENTVDLFDGEGEIGNEKMLVAKVTKERKMSAKSKTSKKSHGSTTTHTRGKFNVTVEVQN